MDIIQAAQAKRDQDEAKYTTLLDRLVHNKPVHEAEALTIIDSVDKSPEDLDREVKTRKRILELEAIIATDPEVQGELRTHNQELGELQKTLEEVANHAQRELTARMTEANRKGYVIELKRRKIREARVEYNRLTQPKEPDGPLNPDKEEYNQALQKYGNLTPVYR